MQEIRSVCVVGAGAIGSLFAGHLGSVVQMKVLTRREEHAALLNAHGLKVRGKSALHARISAATDAAALGDVDLLIIATYAMYDEAELAKFEPDLVYVDSRNHMMNQRHKIPVQLA